MVLYTDMAFVEGYWASGSASNSVVHCNPHPHIHVHPYQPPDIPVEEEEWYFGDIDRRLAENKCKVEGDYMVRYSERQRKYVLTCKYKGSAKHFVIQVFTDVSA